MLWASSGGFATNLGLQRTKHAVACTERTRGATKTTPLGQNRIYVAGSMLDTRIMLVDASSVPLTFTDLPAYSLAFS